METRVYNPEGSILRNDQLLLLEVLKGFADICREHDIKWWICAGTLLGAMRHKGFIPWDDDVDVTMYKKDYRKLQKVLRHLKCDKFEFLSVYNDPEYVNPWIMFKITDKYIPSTSSRKIVGIDVFCIEKSSRFAAHVAKFFYYNMTYPAKYIKSSPLRKFVKSVAKVLNFGILLPLTRMIALINPKKQYHCELGSGFYEYPFYAEHIDPLTQVEFEGVMFPAPGNSDAYLTALYGDWRKLPSEEDIKKSIHLDMYIKQIFGE